MIPAKRVATLIAVFAIISLLSFSARASLVLTVNSPATNVTIDGTPTACGAWATGASGTPAGLCAYSLVNGGSDASVFPFLSSLSLAFKDDGPETGSLSGSYMTDLVPGVSNNVDITYIAGKDFVNCSADCWMMVKDGNASPNPARYLFNLALIGWDGTETIDLNNFFAGKAISHVAIWGDISPIPVPAAFWLFGTALIGFIGISRRRTV